MKTESHLVQFPGVQAGSFFRDMENFAIKTPERPQPTLGELQAKFNSEMFRVGAIECDTSPTDGCTLKLSTFLLDDELKIAGVEYEYRLSCKREIVLGYQQASYLATHHHEFPALMAFLGKCYYIDFPALVMIGTDGRRAFPSLFKVNGRLCFHYRWVMDSFDQQGRIAGFNK